MNKYTAIIGSLIALIIILSYKASFSPTIRDINQCFDDQNIKLNSKITEMKSENWDSDKICSYLRDEFNSAIKSPMRKLVGWRRS
ncbi:hypothetical protein COY15_05140, partial [Candidatus Roizmanbacteria bacterium CG_4_10_14_0_2_um_filter_39_12]